MKKNIIAGIIIVGLIAIVMIALLYQALKKSPQPTSIKKQEKTVYKLTFGHNMKPNSALHVAAQKFTDMVQAKSDGRLKVEIFPAQELGNDHQMTEMAREGKLAILLTPTAKMSTLVPAMQYPDLPFLFPNPEDAYELLDGEPGNILLEQLKPYGLIGASFWGNGFKQFTANRPIRAPEDFTGLNIRVMKSRIIMDQFKAFGANPIPIDFYATYQALKDGVVDGEENPLVAIVSMKFHEVQSHLIISNHAYLAYVFCFSQQIFESLPPDIQDILMSTARELTAFQREETEKLEAAFLATITASDTHVDYLSDEELKRFRETTAHVIEKNRDAIGSEVLDKTFEFLQKKYGSEEKDEILIGLDADMSFATAMAGLSIKRGMELAVNEINQKGGILGKKVKIITRDHGGIPARGISNIKSFSKMKNLVAIMGGKQSSVAVSELDVIHKENIIFLIPWAGATSLVKNDYHPNYVFRVSTKDEYAAPFLVNQAMKESRQIALLLANNVWGRSCEQAMVKSLAENELTPVAIEWINREEEDVTPQLVRIENAGAGIIILVANPDDGARTIKSMARRPGKIPVISHQGIIGGRFWEQVKKELASIELRFLQTFSFMTSGNEKKNKVIQAYFETFHVDSREKIFAPAGTAHAYDLVHILAKAINRAGSIDRSAVRDAMEQIESYEGLVKNYAPPFTPKRHDALDQGTYFMAQFNGNGHIVPVTENSSSP